MKNIFRRFPHLRQPDSMECGATCLRIIATHYGKTFSAERLRQLCDISHNGVSMMCMNEAAHEMGFRTACGKMTVGKLVENRPLPCILHWHQDHFVVLYDIRKNRKGEFRFLISDPARCRLTVDSDTFIENWTSGEKSPDSKGIMMALEPTEEFFKSNENNRASRSLSFLWSHLRQYGALFSQLAAGIVIAALFQLAFPFLMQAVVDKGVSGKNINIIYLILCGELMLVAGSTVVEFIRRWILLHISTRVNISLLSGFFLKLMKLPLSFFDTKLRGDILQRIQDHDRLQRFMTTNTLMTVFAIFSVIVLGGVLWFYDLTVFLIFFGFSLLYTVWLCIFLQKRKALDYEFFDLYSRSQNKSMEILDGMQDIKLQNSEQRKRFDWEDTQADLFRANVASTKLQQKQEAGSKLINELRNILITIVTAALVIEGDLTLGTMLSIQYIVGQLNVPVDRLVRFIYAWQDVQIGIERINEVHQKENEDTGRTGTEIEENASIIIKDMSFSYSGNRDKKALEDINLVIPAGKTTAIVGASGSGKTTLIKLLLGFYVPQSGSIHIGETDLRDLNLEYWRGLCGTVMQDGYIFSESLARNIAFDNNDIDMDRVEEAARIANVTDILPQLPQGYNTMIGTSGRGLSQGQKQRVLIARALYKDARFLFFDEATNSLDTENEREITDKIEKFTIGRTTLIIAHRLSTVRNADNIVVLDNGHIVESGTHRELVKKQGAYFRLIRNQLELGEE